MPPDAKVGGGGNPRLTPQGAVFDMDGVLVDSARIHARAWKEMFDDCLVHLGRDDRFEIDDYRRHVDGRPRYEGVASFLNAKGIDLPPGDPSDPPGMQTEAALGNLKNQIFHRLLDESEISPLKGVIELLDALRAEGTPVGVVSSSRNTERILPPQVAERVDVVLGGTDLDEHRIPGKPEPDMFLRATDDLGLGPDRVAVVEDSAAGVIAGRQGGFALVVGVADDPRSTVAELADVVVTGVFELPLRLSAWPDLMEPPTRAIEHLSKIRDRLGDGPLYVGADEEELAEVRRRNGVGVLVHPEPSSQSWADFFIPNEEARADLLARLDPSQG